MDFNICSLFFLIVIACHFFSKNKLNISQNNFFALFFILGILDILIDTISSYTISYAGSIPLWINVGLNTVFYVMQLSLIALFFLYVLSVVGVFSKSNSILIIISLIPYFIFSLLVLLNPYTGWFFRFDSDFNYIKGNGYICLFLSCVFYFALSMIMMTIYRKQLTKAQLYSLLSLILFICFAAVMQFYNPELLLTGTALTLSVFTMYLTLQNPDNLRDEMTGMMNNEGYLYFMRQRISTHKMSNMIFISIDDFDMLCDSFGLRNVNSAIIQMVKYIKTNVEKSDCFRVTKSHFLIVPKKRKTFDDGVVRLADRLKKPWIVDNNEIYFAVSMIYSTDIVHRRNAEDLLILLHELVLMVRKKKEGVPKKSEFIAIADLYREIRIEEALKEALEKHTLEVYLQPVYSVTKNKFTSAEALLRFTHPILGKIAPSEMIPLAEKNGMIVKIGEYVLDEVCRFIKENEIGEKEYLEYISINVSATEMLQNTFPKEVIRTINKYGIDPAAIVFEMTEYMVVTSNDAVRKNMHKLQEFGVGFTLDDFGSGFSNIDSVMKLPFTTIKLDRSLLAECFYNVKSSIILERTVKLIHELGIYALVEGVETAFQYDMINKLCVDYSQGYYNAFPMPMKECLDFVIRSEKI